jgi:hypothetical protein
MSPGAASNSTQPESLSRPQAACTMRPTTIRDAMGSARVNPLRRHALPRTLASTWFENSKSACSP